MFNLLKAMDLDLKSLINDIPKLVNVSFILSNSNEEFNPACTSPIQKFIRSPEKINQILICLFIQVLINGVVSFNINLIKYRKIVQKDY